MFFNFLQSYIFCLEDDRKIKICLYVCLYECISVRASSQWQLVFENDDMQSNSNLKVNKYRKKHFTKRATGRMSNNH